MIASPFTFNVTLEQGSRPKALLHIQKLLLDTNAVRSQASLECQSLIDTLSRCIAPAALNYLHQTRLRTADQQLLQHGNTFIDGGSACPAETKLKTRPKPAKKQWIWKKLLCQLKQVSFSKRLSKHENTSLPTKTVPLSLSGCCDRNKHE